MFKRYGKSDVDFYIFSFRCFTKRTKRVFLINLQLLIIILRTSNSAAAPDCLVLLPLIVNS